MTESSEPGLIEVRTNWGDWAEAESPEAAMLAAKTLWDDAVEAGTIPRDHPGVGFYVVGERVQFTTSRAALGAPRWSR